MHEIAAVAVAKILWQYGKEVHEAGPEDAPHGHRWFGDRNGLRVAWGFTFGDTMPAQPIAEIKFEKKTFRLYVKEGATTTTPNAIRMVCLIPGNQAAVRAIDMAAIRGAMGESGVLMIERALRLLGASVEEETKKQAAGVLDKMLDIAKRELTRPR